MEIKITKAGESERRPMLPKGTDYGFGRYFTDHMFEMDWHDGRWNDPRIVPYKNLSLDPAAMVFHYAQAIFEGMKAYRGKDGGIYLFRPMKNMERMNNSARRLVMPEFDADLVMQGMEKLVLLDRDWIPEKRGESLYIRPTMIATEPALGVKPSGTYLFFIIVGPVAAYYPTGFNPVKIHVADEHVRAVRGGIGESKAAANYAASLYAAEKAKKAGYTQVLWLDAVDRKSIEEVGTMNIFFLFDNELVTPPLKGSILPGVTRDSVIKVASDFGVKVVERAITIDEVCSGAEKGALKEVFGTGTAAVISPVCEISYKGKTYKVGDGTTGELSKKLFNYLLSLQYGEIPDPYGWVKKIG
jgi:branched-chain amino acid aminotransferase